MKEQLEQFFKIPKTISTDSYSVLQTPEATDDLPCKDTDARKICRGLKCTRWRGLEVSRMLYRNRYYPCLLTMVENRRVVVDFIGNVFIQCRGSKLKGLSLIGFVLI
ncbi:hypothetical protein TNCV_3235981 [Trichonephila clavipes]|nr:hypothetical protein TNCV_3235981 [Trichonephila clavipes]